MRKGQDLLYFITKMLECKQSIFQIQAKIIMMYAKDIDMIVEIKMMSLLILL